MENDCCKYWVDMLRPQGGISGFEGGGKGNRVEIAIGKVNFCPYCGKEAPGEEHLLKIELKILTKRVEKLERNK